MKKETLLVTMLAGLAAAQPSPHSYVGAGGCKSSNCHGGTSQLPEGQSRILGNEFATWFAIDKHASAYKVLGNPRSKRMAEILNITDPSADKRCTICHVAGSPAKNVSDGVACEACHGPASDWLGSHLQLKSNSPEDLALTHADSVRKGMTDTKRLEVRATMCLDCHLGQGSQVVDHDLIAAGHPDLAFELDTFTMAQPAHHRQPKPAPENSLPRVRAWAVGQSVALAQGMRLLATHASKRWPEFSDLECYQCHHDLRADSWRIQRGYRDRRPGSLQMNLARFDVLRELVAQVGTPAQAASLDRGMRGLANIVSERAMEGAAIAQAATSLGQTADVLTARFVSLDFNTAITMSLIRALARNIQRIAQDGVNSAEQATMSLDSLTSTLSPQDPGRQKAVGALYDYLEHPSAYKPEEFTVLYQKAAKY